MAGSCFILFYTILHFYWLHHTATQMYIDTTCVCVLQWINIFLGETAVVTLANFSSNNHLGWLLIANC